MHSNKRLLVIGLDGFEISLADHLMACGRMPNLAALRERSARFRLDHELAKYTGLAWEHFSTGLTPEALNRHSAVTFDPKTYHVRLCSLRCTILRFATSAAADGRGALGRP